MTTKTKKSFAVINPPIIFYLCLCIIAFFVPALLASIMFLPPPHTADCILCIVFVFIPITITALWAKMFRIKVVDTSIFVRKRLGLVNFSFDISEIDCVKHKIAETAFGQTESYTIYTQNGKKVSVETLMVNSDKLMKYIEENVDESKIKIIVKTLKKGKR